MKISDTYKKTEKTIGNKYIFYGLLLLIALLIAYIVVTITSAIARDWVTFLILAFAIYLILRNKRYLFKRK